MPTAQEEFWQGSFGDAYSRRNRVCWHKRVPFWREMLTRTRARSVLEVGCNIGANLLALREVDPMLALWGIDVNETALGNARRAGLAVVKRQASQAHTCGRFDLVCTVGLLIHVASEDLPEVMGAIIKASRRWVLAVEYAADDEEPVVYRGHEGVLWRRPFGRLYQGLGLELVAEGEAPADAFDRCRWWLGEVPR
jgi:pseudaminic acid biosynthesis-associated methylase